MVIGIDIGGTNTKIGAVSPDGEIVKIQRLKTREYEKLEDYLNALKSAIEKLSNELGVEFDGIGIGAPNGNGQENTIDFAPNLPWKGRLFLARDLGKATGLACSLINDASAAALGEKRYGIANHFKDFVVITIGTGLGSGIFSNGEIVNGHNGMAGEVGHMSCSEPPRKCTCGRYGCLETYVSKRGILQTYEELNDSKKSITSVRTLGEMAKNGDKIALRAFERTGEVLGKSLADVMAITGPEAFIFFGGIVRNEKYFMEAVRKSYEQNCLHIYRGKAKFMISSLQDQNAAILGSAALIRNKLESQ